MDRSGRVQEDRAGEPAVPPLVLVLDVRRVGPLDHAQVERVLAGPDEIGHVELGGEVGVLADADVRSFRRGDQDALRRADVEDHPALPPAGRQLEGPLVDPGRLALREVRRQTGERHLDVGVVRFVGEALHGPRAGDRDLAPAGGRVRIGWSSSWNRHVPSSSSRSPWGTLCIGRRPSWTSSGATQGGGCIRQVYEAAATPARAVGWFGSIVRCPTRAPPPVPPPRPTPANRNASTSLTAPCSGSRPCPGSCSRCSSPGSPRRWSAWRSSCSPSRSTARPSWPGW